MGRFAKDSCNRTIEIYAEFSIVQEVRLDRGGTKPAGKYLFFYGKMNKNHELGTG